MSTFANGLRLAKNEDARLAKGHGPDPEKAAQSFGDSAFPAIRRHAGSAVQKPGPVLYEGLDPSELAVPRPKNKLHRNYTAMLTMILCKEIN
jgi:hypothetical protein